MPTDNAEHMTDISTQEDNANNEILADSDSLQIQAIANSIVPKILQGVNERLHNLMTNILPQKGFKSTEGYDDEFDEEKSDRDASAQNNQIIRDAGTQQTGNWDAAQQITKNMAADAQNFGKKKYVNTHKLSETMQITQIQQIIKVSTMWMNYCNIPATLQENVHNQQHHPLQKETGHLLCK